MGLSLMNETELILLQTWTSKDFFILFVVASLVLYYQEYSVRRLKKYWQPIARPLSLFFISWMFFTVANIIGTPRLEGPSSNIYDFTVAPVIGITSLRSFAYTAGLRTGDRILTLNKTEVTTWSDVQTILKSLSDSKTRETDIEIQRGQEKVRFQFHLIFLETESFAGMVPNELFLEEVYPQTPAAVTGLQSGDQIKSVNKMTFKNWSELRTFINETPQINLEFVVNREGQEISTTLYHEPGQSLGFRSSLILNSPLKFPVRTANPFEALSKSFLESLAWSTWVFEKMPLLAELPKLGSGKRSAHWFAKNPQAHNSFAEIISYYLSLVGIFCSNALPFSIIGAPLVPRSSFPKLFQGLQIIVTLAVLSLLWLLLIASADRYFNL